MANALQDRIDTEIIVSSYNSNLFVQKIKENNLKYKKLNIRSLSRNKKNIFLYIINFIPELVFLTLYFKRNQFDIIHVSGGAWQIKGVLSGWFARRKIIWHLNDTSMPGFILWVLKILSALPDAFIFSSENTKKYYADKISKSSYLYEVIHPPVNTSRYCDENIAIEPSFKKIIKDKIVIGTVANINPIKGIDVFVKMVAELNKVRNDFLFVVVGKVYENQISYYQKCLDQITNNKINNNTFKKTILEGQINLKYIAFLSPYQVCPEKWAACISKIKTEEDRENNIEYSDIYKCKKCGESKSKVTQKQTRCADEPPTTFVKCLVCGNAFKFC